MNVLRWLVSGFLLVAASSWGVIPQADAGTADWMGENKAYLENRTLKQIVIPGSHDAGMYTSSDCITGASGCNTVTQSRSVYDQLMGGSRYFDLRPTYYEGAWYAGHYGNIEILGLAQTIGCNGGAMDDILYDVKRFLDVHPNELIVLDFSHFLSRDGAVTKLSFVEWVLEQMDGYIVTLKTEQDNLLDMKFADIMKSGRVIARFEVDYSDKTSGIFKQSDLNIYDKYANKQFVQDMRDDQKEKLYDSKNHLNMFLLSWTLTQTPEIAATCVTNPLLSILTFAQTANSELASFITDEVRSSNLTYNNWPNNLYVDDSGGVLDRSTEQAVLLNQRFCTETSKMDPQTISATKFGGGSITPEGEVTLPSNGSPSQTFTITPDQGYKIGFVEVDGRRLPENVTSYTFTNTCDKTTAHSINAYFVPDAPPQPALTENFYQSFIPFSLLYNTVTAEFKDASINAVAVHPNGKVWVGGEFARIDAGGAGYYRSNLARMTAGGALDTEFNTAVDAYDPTQWTPRLNPNYAKVDAIAVQADGKVIIGGKFDAVNQDVLRKNLARLHPDGSLDTTFSPNVNGPVHAVAIDGDGNILIGGDFTTPLKNIARLSADGTADAAFTPSAPPDKPVRTIALQPDGKIVIGGDFTGYLMRLTENGTLDSSFPVASGMNNTVHAVAIQRDGKIVVGGTFDGYLLRLAESGVDAGFVPAVDGPVYSLALQADTDIILGGDFNTVGGQGRYHIARIKEDGSVDQAYFPYADNTVLAVSVLPDGSTLFGGNFSQVSGQERNRLARVASTGAVTDRIAANAAGSRVTWTRSGPLPELAQVTFTISQDGSAWTEIGKGTRTAGGWELIAGIPADHYIRAQGRVAGGPANGSSSVLEKGIRLRPPATLPAGTYGSSYGPQTLSVTEWEGETHFSVSAGSLPPGLSLSDERVLSGTPTSPGSYSFGIQENDDWWWSFLYPGARIYTVTIDKAAAGTAIRSGTNPAGYGHSVSFTATVPADATGTVTFTEEGATLCADVPVVSGLASCSTAFQSLGLHTVRATYSGDANYLESDGTFEQTINRADQTITVTSHAPAQAAYTSSFTVAATSDAGAAVAISATGVCSGSGLGSATVTMTASFGACSIRYSQAGDFNHMPAADVTETTMATHAQPSVSVTSTTSSSAYGEPVTFTATIPEDAGGWLYFGEKGTPYFCWIQDVSGGEASCTVDSLTVGTHTVGADYWGDSNYYRSAGTIVHTVYKATTPVSLASEKNPYATGRSVTFTATMPSYATGTVTFAEGDAVHCSSVPLSNGAASCTVPFPSAGSRTITATYSGDANYEPSVATLVQSTTDVSTMYAVASGMTSGLCESWGNACSLQYALRWAPPGVEIWVKAGTHKPTGEADRTATFQLRNRVALYGGFAGTETLRSQRDPAANVTILSGDLKGDDGPDFSGYADNSYHVVTGSGTDNTAVLDGFTVTGGHASSGTPHDRGAGMYNGDFSSPVVSGVTFSRNKAGLGGGMSNGSQSKPVVENVVFSDNVVSGYGGGMYNYSAAPLLTNVTFFGNRAVRGGGVFNQNVWNLKMTNVTFSSNSAVVTNPATQTYHGRGGGMYNDFCSFELTNATFSGNTAVDGAGIYNNRSNPSLTNVTIAGNTAAGNGGGISGGMYNYSNSRPTVKNSIIWGNTPASSQIFDDGSSTTAAASIIQGGFPGAGNFQADPLLGSLDDYGGFTKTISLQRGSAAINAADPAFCPATDQRGMERDGVCDIGAFEFQVTPASELAVAATIASINGAPATGGASVIDVVTNRDVTLVADTSANGADNTYAWRIYDADGGGFRTLAGSSVTTPFRKMGRVPVMLVVTNGKGASKTASQTVLVKPLLTAALSAEDAPVTAIEISGLDTLAPYDGITIYWGDGKVTRKESAAGKLEHAYSRVASRYNSDSGRYRYTAKIIFFSGKTAIASLTVPVSCGPLSDLSARIYVPGKSVNGAYPWKKGVSRVLYLYIKNNGPSPNADVALAVPDLPPGLVLVSAKPPAGTSLVNGIWSIGTLASRRTAILPLVVKATADVGETITYRIPAGNITGAVPEITPKTDAAAVFRIQ